ncbi:isopropanol dehydrogenase [Aspergillus fumigatus Z5]|nr:isopropanol dehydrogenase [Aspergillus fumigatus Z5]
MATHQAIILPGINLPLTLASVPTPAPQSGQVLIKVLASPILAYYRTILPGKRPYPLSLPPHPWCIPNRPHRGHRIRHNSTQTGPTSVVGVATEGLNETSLKDAMRKATPRGLGADLFLDFTPSSAAEGQKWIHLASAISALKANGRAVLMGGASDAVSLPYSVLMMRNITVKGNFMFDGTAPVKLIRLIETGN